MCFIDKQMRAMISHAILNRALALSCNAARHHNDLRAAEDFVHLGNATWYMPEHGHDRELRAIYKHGTSRIFQYPERKKLVRNLRTEGISWNNDEEP